MAPTGSEDQCRRIAFFIVGPPGAEQTPARRERRVELTDYNGAGFEPPARNPTFTDRKPLKHLHFGFRYNPDRASRARGLLLNFSHAAKD